MLVDDFIYERYIKKTKENNLEITNEQNDIIVTASSWVGWREPGSAN